MGAVVLFLLAILVVVSAILGEYGWGINKTRDGWEVRFGFGVMSFANSGACPAEHSAATRTTSRSQIPERMTDAQFAEYRKRPTKVTAGFTGEKELLFIVWTDRCKKEYRIYTDGSTEGFGEDVAFSNHYPGLLRRAFILASRETSNVTSSEAGASHSDAEKDLRTEEKKVAQPGEK